MARKGRIAMDQIRRKHEQGCMGRANPKPFGNSNFFAMQEKIGLKCPLASAKKKAV
jgi:hypothetical protein